MRAGSIRDGRIRERGGKVGEREGRKKRNGSVVDPTKFGRKSTPLAQSQAAYTLQGFCRAQFLSFIMKVIRCIPEPLYINRCEELAHHEYYCQFHKLLWHLSSSLSTHQSLCNAASWASNLRSNISVRFPVRAWLGIILGKLFTLTILGKCAS